MTPEQKAKFILALHKHSLQAFDSGGVVTTMPGIPGLTGLTQNNFQAQAANINPGTNAGQLNQAYNTAQGGLSDQQNLINQLQAQNGIGNQSQVYNQQQGLAQQLQAESEGAGPNPAQAALNQNTATNVANQAALMASQRGASNNVGLEARQAAMQGASTQQQAAGQAATLQAQQQLAAQSQLQQQQQNLANTATNQVNEQGQAIGGLNTAAQNEQNILQGANSNFNTANVGLQSNLNNVNAQISQGNQAASNNLLGGILNAGGSIVSSLLAKGGMVGRDGVKSKLPPHLDLVAKIYHPKHYDSGGEVTANLGTQNYAAPVVEAAPNIGSMPSQNKGSEFASSSGGSSGGGGLGAGIAALAALAKGGRVPGNPKTKSNNIKNDVVPALLTPKEIVLPISITMHKNAPEKAAAFVRATLAKRKAGSRL